MTEFTLHTAETAPDGASPLFEKSIKAFGMVPNLHAVMAESPELLDAYQSAHTLFQASSLSDVERNIVWMAINVQNQCHYCVPAHSAIAKMQGVDDATIEQLRNGEQLSDQRLETLRSFTLEIVRQHGRLDEAQVQAFLDAGFTKRNILDVILGVAQKTMSNYVNHFADTPVDAMFASYAWEPA
ncbi:Macrophage infectivity potentiator-related protein [hydrothermal vent metagenome]|uniref:Macrophage infectivity potentiator-related protein n=1 Tax=hydrothermal vent metagenome TaxID=652676 RepID=A0A3B0R976_9ZZZZ